jgi:hypothetical protein
MEHAFSHGLNEVLSIPIRLHSAAKSSLSKIFQSLAIDVVGNFENSEMREHGEFSTIGCGAGLQTKSHSFGTLSNDLHHGRDVRTITVVVSMLSRSFIFALVEEKCRYFVPRNITVSSGLGLVCSPN